MTDILAILRDDLVWIPELKIHTSKRGDLAAFWDGFRAGQAGADIPGELEYDEPGVYRRAHERGRVSRNQLT